jgi:Raf kinase inhibitor-like YbhB/YbcL family protein
MMRKRLGILAAVLLLPVFGCAPASDDTTAQSTQEPAVIAEATVEPAQTEPAEAQAAFTVTSAGVVDGVMDDAFGMRGTQLDGFVPTRSLPLDIANAPDGTACLAISMIDPDGGDWVHWLAVNVPVGNIPENASVELAGTFAQGGNDFGTVGYGGPTPPSGVHTYVITVYALSETVSLEDGFSQDEFAQAIDGKTLAQAVLTGTYAS